MSDLAGSRREGPPAMGYLKRTRANWGNKSLGGFMQGLPPQAEPDLRLEEPAIYTMN